MVEKQTTFKAEKLRIYCYRDAVISTEAITPKKGIDEDETPRGRKYSKKGGIVSRVIFAVDLYFVLPSHMGKSGYMRLVQDHFANEITKWNEGILEYLPRPLSTASADESYYKNMIVQMLGADKKAFAFEISDMGEQSKSFRYHGLYCVHAWRNHEGRAIERPGLPMDWNVRELTARVKQVLQ